MKNNNQWKGKPLSEDNIATYKELLWKPTLAPVAAHDTYLINLCAVDGEILKKSRAALKDELDRCERLAARKSFQFSKR